MILLLFVGQVMSATFISCSSGQPASQSMSMMDMSLMPDHDMSMMHASGESNMDCCDDCQCTLRTCVNNPFIASTVNIPLYDSVKSNLTPQRQLFINQLRSPAIFYPPILS